MRNILVSEAVVRNLGKARETFALKAAITLMKSKAPIYRKEVVTLEALLAARPATEPEWAMDEVSEAMVEDVAMQIARAMNGSVASYNGITFERYQRGAKAAIQAIAAHPEAGSVKELVQVADDAVRACMAAWGCGEHSHRMEMVAAVEALQAALARRRSDTPADVSHDLQNEVSEVADIHPIQQGRVADRLRKRAAFFDRLHPTADLLREAADVIQSQTAASAQSPRSTDDARTADALVNARGLLQAFTGPNDAIAQTAISEIDAVLVDLENGRLEP